MATDETRRRRNIPVEEKRRKLLDLTEKDFRNNVIRTLFLQLGYEAARETHGPDELGKDIVFTETNKLGQKRLIAVQTKKGKINMAAKHSTNAANIAAQLRTALVTSVHVPGEQFRKKPDEVYLCSSGTINTKARDYIQSEVDGRHIKFLDSEDIISLVDEHCPDVWLGITSDVYSYYDAIRKHVEVSDTDDIISTHISDESYVHLHLVREAAKRQKVPGTTEFRPYYETFTDAEILNRISREASDDFIILSDAGTGKSTLLWRLAYLVAKTPSSSKKILPLIVSAKELTRKDIGTPDSFVRYCAGEAKKLTDAIELSKTTFENGELLLMVDALDEIGDGTLKAAIVQFLFNQLKGIYSSLKIICTSRPDSDLTEYWPRPSTYRIEPPSTNQAKKILETAIRKRKRISRSDENLIVRHAQKVLKRVREMHGFELSPLLLTIFAYTADYEIQDIPANVTELFKKFTEFMLERWDKEKGLSQQFEYVVKDFVVKKIAYAMHERSVTRISRTECREIIRDVLSDRGYSTEIDILYTELVERSRLLRIQNNTVSFSHHLLQEFFAGRGIPDITKISSKQMNSPWWTKCLVFYFGEHAEDAEVLRKLQKKGGRPTLPRNRAIGLALQACFLSKSSVKMEIWRDIVSDVETLLEKLNSEDRPSLFPIFTFFQANEYIKDALALFLLRQKDTLEKVLPDWDASDLRRFLIFTALLESGNYDLVKSHQRNNLRFTKGHLSIAFYFNLVARTFLDPKDTEAKNLCSYFEKNMVDKRQLRELNDEILKIIGPHRRTNPRERKRLAQSN